ncbi:MAG TPA: ABC transporter substrate-binding protein [Ramlibacter sp.]|jgi:NitT/TauT family transport system substrate-binding protein|uniref:ABC transporter substrate-binding protein n=1 Tax=Ramlibacter sp. TaxID=1917967 RepID=UPI002D330DA9|nr:ABC transporter substrate-binding protein [Ramlibacter sp.]HZY18263.1 ABC transporter substrate-binding protein [Ramlibacter sp.]
MTPIARTLLATALGLATCAAAQAQDKLTYMTNWYAQAEHGGFYQAVATGLYKKHGLDVTIKMGGPQVNTLQLMAAGQADCIMGSSDMQMMVARAGGLPVVTVAAVFQKDPQVLISHDNVRSFEEMKDKTILIAPSAQRGYWLWLKSRYGLKDEQTRPYTFNIQPFVADRNTVQQGYLTSEPFAIQKAGVKANTHLFADHGWSSYATTVSCMEETVKSRPKVIENFVKATMEGWKSFLADPAPGAALIRKDNPNMTDEQIAYSVGKLKEMGIITSGDARSAGIGVINEARARQNHAFLVDNKLIDGTKLKFEDAFRLDWVKTAKVLP